MILFIYIYKKKVLRPFIFNHDLKDYVEFFFEFKSLDVTWNRKWLLSESIFYGLLHKLATHFEQLVETGFFRNYLLNCREHWSRNRHYICSSSHLCLSFSYYWCSDVGLTLKNEALLLLRLMFKHVGEMLTIVFEFTLAFSLSLFSHLLSVKMGRTVSLLLFCI